MSFSIKNKKRRFYISGAIYLLFSFIIVGESCLPSSLSTSHSGVFAQLGAMIINIFNPPREPNIIKPNGIKNTYDSTYVGKDEHGYSNIIVGTTSLITFEVNYPNKGYHDVLDYTYNVESVLGNKTHYNTILSSSKGEDKLTINLRIVANEYGDDLYQIDIKSGDQIYNYKFNILAPITPVEYESNLDTNDFLIGESRRIAFKLKGNEKDDYYLRRYYKQNLLNHSSSDESVAKVDENGVITTFKKGNATIRYGNDTYNINVKDEAIIKPINNELSLEISPLSNNELYLLDYDYVFSKEDDPNDYSVLVKAKFLDESLTNKEIKWSISSNISAILAPYKYDDNGYPIYKDEEGNSCIRVCGYRKAGDVILSATSYADNSLSETLSLNVKEATPESFNISLDNDLSLMVGDQKILSATFTPKNTHNTAISAVCDNNDVISITNNNSSSITLSANNIGNAKINVTSIANPSLTKTINIKVEAAPYINDDNFGDFHSFIRKFAGHFSLFLITAVVGFIFFFSYHNEYKKIKWTLLISCSSGLFLAIISEFIQYFIPSRTGTVLDVCIDFIGYVVGTFIVFGIISLIRHIKKKKETKEE